MVDLSSLNPQQLEAVKAIYGPVCVIAGAGSGKTKALTSRIAYMLEKGINPYSILAITFTKKAAGEMRERVAKLIGNEEISQKIEIRTFHSFCANVLRKNTRYAKHLADGFTIVDSDDSLALIKTCMAALNIDTKKYAPKLPANFISTCKNNLIHVDEADISSFSDKALARMCLNVYAQYQDDLEKYNRCDFDDLLMYVVDMFRENKDLLFRYQNRYRYILIDEYQDTNPAQYALAMLLTGENKNIFVVGDADQAIYGFRGSDYHNIMNFRNDFPQAKQIKLEQNYRSTDVILEAANAVIRHNVHRIPKNLRTDRVADTNIVAYHAEDAVDEARWVLSKIRDEVYGNHRRFSDCCILIRNNSISKEFEDIFVRNNIPYVIVGAKRFYDRKEIRDTMAYLRFLANPNDMISFNRIYNVPARGVGKTSYNRLMQYMSDNDLGFFETMEKLGDDLTSLMPKKAAGNLVDLKNKINVFYGDDRPLAERFFAFLNSIDYFSQYEDGRSEDREINKTRVNNIQLLLQTCADFKNDDEEAPDIQAFLDYVALLSDADTMKNTDAVTVMTCHASKGLEFPVVFIAAFEENVFPSWQSLQDDAGGNDEAVEEERRLCYVAITRAKDQLYLSNVEVRRMFNQTNFNDISRFYDEIPTEYIDIDE